MNITINSRNKDKNTIIRPYSPSFKGPLDGVLTSALQVIDTNPMANAALVDTFAMVLPRTYVDTKKRNKYAGAETFFREATGTVIVCLSAGVVAKGIASVYNKIFDKKTNIPSHLWVTNDSFDAFKSVWENSGKGSDAKIEKYVRNVLTNLSGLDGKQTSTWENVDWKKVEWFDSSNWEKINWKNPKFKNIQNELKSEDGIVKVLSDLIKDKNVHKSDIKNVFKIVEHRITNAIKVNSSVNLKTGEKTFNASLSNIIRDTHDVAKNIFTDNSVILKNAEHKLKTMNRVKTLGAIGFVSAFGLLDQYVNRLISKKRLGHDNFVGTMDINAKNEPTENSKKSGSKIKLTAYKLLASGGIFALAMKVMDIKTPKEFIKKLEFRNIGTSGNAIKTVYTALLIGRFLASRDKDELRESVTRDYLGFLNWLVFGGFVSKGVGQILFDKKLNSLFNVNESTKGIKNWLNNFTPKSHIEIAAKGADFAKKNIWKTNIMHISGLLYSGLALGFALPLLNIFITGDKKKQNGKIIQPPSLINFSQNIETPSAFKSFGGIK